MEVQDEAMWGGGLWSVFCGCSVAFWVPGEGALSGKGVNCIVCGKNGSVFQQGVAEEEAEVKCFEQGRYFLW